MTQEDKQLLLVDLCARLPYGLKCQFEDTIRVIDEESSPFYDYTLSVRHLEIFMRHNNFHIKPYLRPMSSMTEYELQRYHELCDVDEAVGVGSSIEIIATHDTPESLDYLNSIHVDYRGLIPKGLAISTEEFNPYK